MEPQACAEASQLLVRCWDRREVIPALPEPLRPATRREGYAVQAQLTAQGQKLFGSKVAASSEAGQRPINVDGPLAGRILAAQVRPDGATIDIRGNRMRVADVEFASPCEATCRRAPAPTRWRRFWRRSRACIPPSRSRTRAISNSLKSAPRNSSPTPPAPICSCRDRRRRRSGATLISRGVLHRGIGANVLGDPRLALTWMADELSEIGVGLAAGLAGGPPDVVFECVGVPGMIGKAVDYSRTWGRIVVVGVCMVEDSWAPMSVIFKETNIQYVLGYGRPDWRLVLDLLDSGRVDPRPMITDIVTLDALPAAFEALRRPTTQIKVRGTAERLSSL
jgi:hypothetical protein